MEGGGEEEVVFRLTIYFNSIFFITKHAEHAWIQNFFLSGEGVGVVFNIGPETDPFLLCVYSVSRIMIHNTDEIIYD